MVCLMNNDHEYAAAFGGAFHYSQNLQRQIFHSEKVFYFSVHVMANWEQLLQLDIILGK